MIDLSLREEQDLEDDNCQASLGSWFGVEYVFEATIDSIGQLIPVRDEGYANTDGAGQELTFSEVIPLSTFGPAELVDGLRAITYSYSFGSDGSYADVSQLDVDSLAVGDRVIVSGRVVPDSFDYPMFVTGFVRSDDGRAEFVGDCDFLDPRAQVVATNLGFEDSYSLMLEWARRAGELGPDAVAVGQPEDLVAAERTMIEQERPQQDR